MLNGSRFTVNPWPLIPPDEVAALTAEALSPARMEAVAADLELAQSFTAQEAARKAVAGEQLSIGELEAVLVRHSHALLSGTAEEQERGEKLLLRIYERRASTAGRGMRAMLRRAHPAGSPAPEAPPAPAT